MKKTIVSIMALILIAAGVKADLCIIRGYAYAPDGSPAVRATPISLNAYAYGVDYPVVTGVDWPYDNFFLQTIRCNPGDAVGITIDTSDYAYFENLTISRNVNDLNITMAAKPKPPVTPGGGIGGGGGGGSTSARTAPAVSVPASESATVALTERQTIEIFTYDRWFDVRRFIAEVYKITDDSIDLKFYGLDLTVSLRTGENKSVDLNEDGYREITMRLDRVVNRTAYMSFIRDINGSVVEPMQEYPANASITPETKSVTPELEMPEPLFAKKHLLLLIIIIDLIIILIIEIRRRKHEDE
jgi:hypothetical protein